MARSAAIDRISDGCGRYVQLRDVDQRRAVEQRSVLEDLVKRPHADCIA